MSKKIEEARAYSTNKVAQLRHELERLGLPKTISVVTTGSFARKEASKESDLDFFLLIENKGMMVDHDYISEIQQTICGIVRKVVGNEPAPDGAFGVYESTDRMLINIGGNSDENDKITRRILLLLECDWLYNQELFDETRGRLLNRYVDNQIRQSNITRFLLNDIIRYYRTVCVDFEYKTFEARKDWGIRNVKLRFSRKLLYFSGVLAVAKTAGEKNKKKVLQEYIGMTPIERLQRSTSKESERHLEAILKEYEFFMDALSVAENRDELKAIHQKDSGESALFDSLQNSSHRMSLEMKAAFSTMHQDDHPIHLGIFN